MNVAAARVRRLRSLGPGLWAIGLAVLTIPAAYLSPGVGLDPSWLAGLNLAFRQHLPWGNGLVWTYGPFGFADFTAYFYFGTWLIAFIVALLVHAGFFATLVVYLRITAGGWWRWAVVAIALLLPLSAFPSVEYELTLTAFLLLYLSTTVAAGRRSMVLAAASGTALGVLLTIKGTGVAAAGALWLTYALYVVLVRRPQLLGSLSAAMAVSFFALWILAAQSPLAIPAYFRGSYEIISGYSAAMSLFRDAPLPVQHFTLQAAFGALVVISSAACFLWALWRRDRPLICLLLLASPLLFLEFKEGYVRFGNRQLVFYSLAALIETIVLVRAASVQNGRWPALGWLQSAAAALACGLLISGVAVATHMVPDQASWPLLTLPTRLAGYGDAVHLVTSSRYRQEVEARNTQQASQYYQLGPDAVSAGPTTDILPWDVEVAYAYSIHWSPHAVFQSYQAYTTYLDQLDAAHFNGSQAPERVLLAYQSIDGRYPPFDEPAVLRALYDGYAVIGQERNFVILQRSDNGSSPSLRAIGTATARLGDPVAVPAAGTGQVVYASVHVPYSLWGRAMSLAFQPSELHVRFQLASGETGPYRFIPAVAGDGLFLGSYIGSLNDLGNILAHQPGTPITSFTITADRARDYQGSVQVTFYASG